MLSTIKRDDLEVDFEGKEKKTQDNSVVKIVAIVAIVFAVIIVALFLFISIAVGGIIAFSILNSPEKQNFSNWETLLVQDIKAKFSEIGENTLDNYEPKIKHYIDSSNTEDQNLRDGTQAHPWASFEEAFAETTHFRFSSKPVDLSKEPEPTQLRNAEGKVKAGHALIVKQGIGYKSIAPDIYGFHISIPSNTSVPEVEKYLYIIPEEGDVPILEGILLQSAGYFYIKGFKLERQPKHLGNSYTPGSNFVSASAHGYNGPTFNVYLGDLEIETLGDESTWNSTDWDTSIYSGISVGGEGTKYIKVENCKLKKVGFGITVSGNYILIANNYINHFLFDAFRGISSYLIFEDNIVSNNYNWKGNGNHNDGWQSWVVDGNDSNQFIILQRNFILLSTDLTRPTQTEGSLQVGAFYFQGIGCFDGPYNFWRVENNMILINHFHAITFGGKDDVSKRQNGIEIIGNYVLPLHWNATKRDDGTPWIRMQEPYNSKVQFNMAMHFSVTQNEPTTIFSNNTVIERTFEGYQTAYLTFKAYLEEKVKEERICDLLADSSCFSGMKIDYQIVLDNVNNVLSYHNE